MIFELLKAKEWQLLILPCSQSLTLKDREHEQHPGTTLQVATLEAASSEHQEQLQASQSAFQEAETGHQAALEERAAEIAQLVEAQNSFYQQYEELTASYQELQAHYETANTQLQVPPLSISMMLLCDPKARSHGQACTTPIRLV